MRYFGFSRGDQHCHTTISSDGISTMEEMIKEAIKKGFKFITFTEHFDSYMYVKQTKATCSDLKEYAAEAERCRKKSRAILNSGMSASVIRMATNMCLSIST